MQSDPKAAARALIAAALLSDSIPAVRGLAVDGRPNYGRGASSRGVYAPVAGGKPPCGRNDPCPCGSKKKFKKCHGGPHAAPLA